MTGQQHPHSEVCQVHVRLTTLLVSEGCNCICTASYNVGHKVVIGYDKTIKNSNTQLRTQNYIYIYYKTIRNSNTQNYEIVYYKTIRFWYTNIHTKIYKALLFN
jgi:hypothetical protein